MVPDHIPVTPALSDGLIDQLTLALATRRPDTMAGDVQTALDAMCTEAHARGLPPESMVLALKTAWSRVPQPLGSKHDEWAKGYYAAVGLCLSAYFETRS